MATSRKTQAKAKAKGKTPTRGKTPTGKKSKNPSPSSNDALKKKPPVENPIPEENIPEEERFDPSPVESLDESLDESFDEIPEEKPPEKGASEKKPRRTEKEEMAARKAPSPKTKKGRVFIAGRTKMGGSIPDLAKEFGCTVSNVRQHISQCHTVLGYGYIIEGDRFWILGKTTLTWEDQQEEKASKKAKKSSATDETPVDEATEDFSEEGLLGENPLDEGFNDEETGEELGEETEEELEKEEDSDFFS